MNFGLQLESDTTVSAVDGASPVVVPVPPAGKPGRLNLPPTKSGLIVLRINQAEKRTKEYANRSVDTVIEMLRKN